MNSKKKGLPANLGENFKGLPVEKRINVLIIARKLLKLQREKEALLEDGGDPSGEDKGGRGLKRQ
jgi:hypothetical protein